MTQHGEGRQPASAGLRVPVGRFPALRTDDEGAARPGVLTFEIDPPRLTRLA